MCNDATAVAGCARQWWWWWRYVCVPVQMPIQWSTSLIVGFRKEQKALLATIKSCSCRSSRSRDIELSPNWKNLAPVKRNNNQVAAVTVATSRITALAQIDILYSPGGASMHPLAPSIIHDSLGPLESAHKRHLNRGLAVFFGGVTVTRLIRPAKCC